ncbi:MAG: CpaF family protein [Lachnospiraceae bacterium]|nr:CpaF family protein [Lachnospiraceae bacterium]
MEVIGIEKVRHEDRKEWQRQLEAKICAAVRKEMDISRELSDEEVYDYIDQVILRETARTGVNMKERIRLRESIFNTLRRLDILQDMLEDPEITEIMMNGYDHIFLEKNGRLIPSDKKFASRERYEDLVQQIVSRANRIVNRASPIVDARLPDGSRVNVIMEPVALDGTTMTIRKFADREWNMDKLIEIGSIDEKMAQYFRLLVLARYNIIVSGGTGSGKTTILNLLSDFIPSEERIVTIEDSAELNLRTLPNLVRLETRDANVEGENQITIQDLIRAALRVRPDRIIVGEVRGGEAFPMIQAAMNTGHDGSLSTCHANSCQDAVSRLETMVLMGCEMPLMAIRGQISSAIDIFIHLGRLRDKSRKVLEVAEVVGRQEGEIVLNTLFRFEETGEKEGRLVGEFVLVNSLLHRTKLKLSGHLEEFSRLEGEYLKDV